MARIPPPPDGFSIVGYGDQPDPYDELTRQGFQATNGFRTDADMARLRAAGYHPAPNSRHLDGDAVDFRPPSGMSFDQARQIALQASAGWPGSKVLNEGDHIHAQWPGYGRAPGTPGTDRFGLPPLPDGFELVQRGSLTNGNYQPGMDQAPPPAAPPMQPPYMPPPQPTRPPSPAENAAARSLLPQDAPGISQLIGKHLQGEGSGFTPAPGPAPDEWEHNAYGRLILGEDPSKPQPAPSLNPYRTDRGESVAALPGLHIDPAAGKPALGGGYQTNVDPDKIAAIQSTYEGGASVSDLMSLGAKLEVRLDPKSVLELVNYRDTYHKAGRFMPDQAPPMDGPRKGETTEDYYDRAFKNQSFDGPYTPSKLATQPGAAIAYTARNDLSALGYGSPDEPVDKVRGLADTASRYAPIVGGTRQIIDAVHEAGKGNYANATLMGALGSIDFIPGGGAGLKAGEHVIEGAAIRAASRAADGTIDIARAHEGIRNTVETILQNGGAVELRTPQGARNIVGTGSKWMVDDAGKRVPFSSMLSEARPHSLKITLPEDAGFFPKVRPGEAPPHSGNVNPDAVSNWIVSPAMVPKGGEPGFSIHHSPDDGTATAIYRDANGDAKGGVLVPLTPEARQNYGGVISYVDPAHRRQGVATKLYDLARNEGLPIDEMSGKGDLTPDGAAFLNSGRTASNVPPPPAGFQMVDDGAGGAGGPRDPGVPGGGNGGGGLPPPRRPDYLPGFRPGEVPPPPPGFQPIDDPQLGRLRPMGQQATPEEMAAAARSIRPEDLTPIPGNQVESLDEAARIPSSQQPLQAPDEFDQLGRRKIPSANDLFKFTNRRGPLDLSQRIRQLGGIQDQGGELSAMGVSNAPRRLDFGNDRGLPNLIKPNGIPLDEMTRKLHEEGWFPHEADRPTPAVLLDALRDEHVNGNRVFHPEDQAEVERFYAAQAERGRVETAAQEGAPLVEHVGQPAGLEDLRAIDNEIPATAYEDLPKVGGRVANINLANLETRGDIRRALQATEVRFGGFDAARRGQITHAETAALASELKMTPDDLLKRRKGQALNAEQALAARQILAKSSDEITQMAAKLGEGASDEQRAAFAKALLTHAAIYEQVTGATAEAGRALSQFRAAARSKAVAGRVHDAIIQGLGGQGKLEDIASGILELQRQGTNPGGLTHFAVNALKPTWKDKLVELWYNSLLSGFQTHIVNVLSNTITAGAQIPEQAAAAGYGLVRKGIRAARGKPDDFDRVLMSEVGPRAIGLMQGAAEGVRAFGRTLMTGEVPDFVAKVESRSQKAISGLKGEVIRIPTRLLSAEDEFFKAIGRRMEMNGLAVRQARSEGYRGQALRDRIAELSANPTDQMVTRAGNYARYITYQQPVGKVGQRISATTQEHPWLKLFIPFVRTPLNIFKFVAERSPAAVLMKGVRADLAAGGERQALAATRIMMGTGLGMYVAHLASQGLITGGGPADPRARAMLMADGWQPYSVKIGGKYYSYQRLDPLATTLGVAADLVDFGSHMTERQQKESAALLVASIARNVANRTWLSGVSDLVSALDDPDRNLQNFTSRLAGSIAVPGAVAQAARVADPVQRDTRELPGHADMNGFLGGALARVESRIPGLSKNLPARRDVWGAEMRGEGGLGPDIISPIWSSTAKNDPVTRELLSLGVTVGSAQRRIGKEHLNSVDFEQYQGTAGRYIHEGLSQAISSAAWQGMSDGDRRAWVKDIQRDARAAAREDFMATRTPPPPPAGFQMLPPPKGFQLVN